MGNHFNDRDQSAGLQIVWENVWRHLVRQHIIYFLQFYNFKIESFELLQSFSNSYFQLTNLLNYSQLSKVIVFPVLKHSLMPCHCAHQHFEEWHNDEWDCTFPSIYYFLYFAKNWSCAIEFLRMFIIPS